MCIRDSDSGVLGDIDPEKEQPVWQKKKQTTPKKDNRKERLDALDEAFAACDLDGGGCVSIAALMEYTGKAKYTIRSWVDEHPDFERQKDGVRRVKNN